ncbi:hypothetical protein [Chelativorans sp. AA-79]|uniref:hypothetical protein n=1 Tax=Chelativorans sp. AA-79 TaxID=3028735 RepID=UPI0023F8B08B|nr:hypothetical protein [Chelativorans sp. AA-79]WEX10865.1 hypothetical protein PVE73_08005 [Chelativorans sp. AA-79]
MARVTELPQMNPVWIWDITDRVGWGLTNRRADVQLVQLSINKLLPKLGLVDFRKPQGMGPMGKTHAPLRPLKVDGYLGNETANAIASYIRHKGHTNDQAIDPVYPLLSRLHGDPVGPGRLMAVSAIQRRTMFFLNRDHVQAYGRLLDTSEFPQPLQGEVAFA